MIKMDSKRRKSSLLQQHTLASEQLAGSVDLLTEILLRSPADSVVKFKCVSKLWYSIITDPEFITNHIRLNPSPPISGIYLSSLWDVLDPAEKPVPFHKLGHLPSFTFPHSFGHSVQFQDSSNGLFLFRCWKQKNDFETRYVVCNPITQTYKLLLNMPREYYMDYSNIAYFPSKTLYKVTLFHEGSRSFHIFCSDSSSWKIVKFPQKIDKFFHWSRTVYLDGVIHWLGGHKKEMYHCQLDVTEEKSKAVELPPEPKILTPDKNRYFGASGGRLFLIQTNVSTATGFNILEMGKGCSCWIVKFRLNLKSVFPEAKDRLMIGNFSVLYIMLEDEEKGAEIVVASTKKVVSYNLARKTVKVLSSFPEGQEKRLTYGFPFQASLATL